MSLSDCATPRSLAMRSRKLELLHRWRNRVQEYIWRRRNINHPPTLPIFFNEDAKSHSRVGPRKSSRFISVDPTIDSEMDPESDDGLLRDYSQRLATSYLKIFAFNARRVLVNGIACRMLRTTLIHFHYDLKMNYL